MRTTTTRKIGSIGTTARIVGGALFITPAPGARLPQSRTQLVGHRRGLRCVSPRHTGLGCSRQCRLPAPEPRRARAGAVGLVAAQAGATVLALLPLFAVATVLMFMTPVHRPTIWVFLGLSMLLAAARGYAGCEVLAIPNTILRRTDAIWCPVYPPIDTAERAGGPQMTADKR
jgi:hypothetical protein